MFSLIGECCTMRTHGHREGSITHWGPLGGKGRTAVGWGGRGGVPGGEIPNVDDRGMDAANHHGMCMYTYVAILHDLHKYPKT